MNIPTRPAPVQAHFSAIEQWLAVQAADAEEDASRFQAVMNWLDLLGEDPTNEERAAIAFVTVEDRHRNASTRAQRCREAIEILRSFH